MTARDLEVLLRQSPDLDELWESILVHSNQDATQRFAAFSRDELQAYVGYICNAVESAPEVPPASEGITYEKAMQLTYRQELFSKTLRDSRGRPLRARVSGQVKTWKRQPGVFYVPLKHGLRDSFSIGNAANCTHHASDFVEYEEEAMQKNVSAKDITTKWERLNPSVQSPVMTNNERVVVIALEDLRIVVRWKHRPDVVSFEATSGHLRGNDQWNRDALDAWRANGAWLERGILEVERYREAHAQGSNKYEGRVWFEYVGEPAPWQLKHEKACMLVEAQFLHSGMSDAATRHCTCDVFTSDEPLKNPAPRVVRSGGGIR